MIYIIITIYIFLSFLSLKSTLKDKLPTDIDYIVVLSGATGKITSRRILLSKNLALEYPNARLIACGKHMEELFKSKLSYLGCRLIIQNESTNTYEDALYVKKIVGKENNMVIITSHSHQIRAFKTFKRVFDKNKIYNFPTNDILTIYSPLLPIGWFASFINYMKDRKYNKGC